MKISILCENHISREGRKGCLAEYGFSAHIDTGKTKVLFDTGSTNVYTHNASYLGIDLEDVNAIALSHHHRDHVNGLRKHEFNTAKPMYMYPDVLGKLDQVDAERIQYDFEVI